MSEFLAIKADHKLVRMPCLFGRKHNNYVHIAPKLRYKKSNFQAP